MSDDEADPELLALLRQSLGLSTSHPPPATTAVLSSAEHISDHSIDVALSSQDTVTAAHTIRQLMREKAYSPKTWATHELHPKTKDEGTVNFIFTMDLLNFCFWSEREAEQRFAVEYRGRKWTGYWSLVAALQRALDEGIPITTPDYWWDEDRCTLQVLQHVFRSATDEAIPLFDKRVVCLREAGQILHENFSSTPLALIEQSNHSATTLINLLADSFPCFQDESHFHDRPVRFLKRAQIFVADLWACFEGQGWGEFHDIDAVTMFADYRIPQILHTLHVLRYAPPLESHIRQLKPIAHDHPWEIQLRGCSIWAVELLRREMRRQEPGLDVNAVLIDFFLYDTMKEMEAKGEEGKDGGKGDQAVIPHHRTRSIWY
ncbi:MAG: hypothetical protein M1817_005527 [Caeruleum heppii]|nr:MAG: hypothetical protein M1817_005527 [Caeruleum heppii]